MAWNRFCLLLIIVVQGTQAATVYKSTDADGQVTYADQPQEQAVVVEELSLSESGANEEVSDALLEQIELMTATTDRLRQDRIARELARKPPASPYPFPVVSSTESIKPHYYRIPRHLSRYRYLPDLRRHSHHSQRRYSDHLTDSAPEGILLKPRSRLLTPRP